MDDATLGDDEDAVGEAEDFGDLAGHDDDGGTLVREPADEGLDHGARPHI